MQTASSGPVTVPQDWPHLRLGPPRGRPARRAAAAGPPVVTPAGAAHPTPHSPVPERKGALFSVPILCHWLCVGAPRSRRVPRPPACQALLRFTLTRGRLLVQMREPRHREVRSCPVECQLRSGHLLPATACSPPGSCLLRARHLHPLSQKRTQIGCWAVTATVVTGPVLSTAVVEWAFLSPGAAVSCICQLGRQGAVLSWDYT